MSRYRGPRLKVMRALGVQLPGLSSKSMEDRPFPPGEAGMKRRGRPSIYGMQLKEKQKLRFNYGHSERTFRRIMEKARRSRQQTGTKLLELLERKLDNVVFRAGYAPTIPAARQLVSHGHLLLNGVRTNIASLTTKVGDVLELKEKSQEIPSVKLSLMQPALERPDWLSFDDSSGRTTITALPTEDSVPFPVDVQLVVEFYS